MTASPAELIFQSSARALTAPWLAERRARANEVFEREGVPNRRIEDWKYTDLKQALEAANGIAPGRVEFAVAGLPSGAELVDFARLAEAPDWVRQHLGKSAAAQSIPAASLAFGESGFALRIPKGLKAKEPVSVQFSGGSGHARALIVLEDRAELAVEETPSTARFSNLGVEIVVGPGSRMTLLRFADAAPDSIQLEDIAVRVARDGEFRAHLVNGGAAPARLNLRLTLREPGASALLSGASVLGGHAHADVTTEIYHASGETRSVQLFKKVIGGTARGVYQGKITVAQGANGSDSRQTAKALLLENGAEADLKPELEILAEDVKCAHGAAVGDLDTEALFYLRSRGVPESEARNLLVRAFLEDALLLIEDERLRAKAWAKVERAVASQTGAVA